MSITKTFKFHFAGLCLVLAANSAMAEIAVVISAKNPAGALNPDQVSDIFLGKGGRLPGGAVAVPVDQAEGASLRNEFYEKNSSKSATQLKAHWAKIIFTGKGQPPKAAGDGTAVKKLVAENPNLIGYIEPGAVDASVRVILTIR